MSEYTPKGLLVKSVTKVCAKFDHRRPLKSCWVCNVQKLQEREQ